MNQTVRLLIGVDYEDEHDLAEVSWVLGEVMNRLNKIETIGHQAFKELGV